MTAMSGKDPGGRDWTGFNASSYPPFSLSIPEIFTALAIFEGGELPCLKFHRAR